MAKISVIVPVYNVEKYLKRCLDTILDQTFSLKYEVICVNDGSTDNSPKILEEYQKKYPNIIKIITQENKGLSEARNTALKHVKGKYTMFVDADDFIARNTLEGLYNYAESHNSDVVVFDFIRGMEGSKKLNTQHYENIRLKYGDMPFNAETAEPYIYKTIAVGVWCKFYKTEFIKNIKFVPKIIYEDVCHWAEVFTKAKKINYYPVPFYFYLLNRENSLTADNTRKVFDAFKVFKISENTLKEARCFEKYKIPHYIRFVSYLMGAVKKMHPSLRREYIEAIKNCEIDIDYDFILNGNFFKYEKEDMYFIKLIKNSDFETVRKFCFEKRIWRS